MKKRSLAALLTAALMFTLAACAPAATTATPAPSAAPSAAAPESTAPTAQPAGDSDLAAIQAKGEMVIGYTVYEPMNYTDDSGVFTGFDTELATAVCEKLGVKPVFQEIVWETKEVELAAGTIDAIWNGLTIDDERKAAMELTAPYVVNAQVVVMRADNSYTDTASLAAATLCAEAGSAGETTITGDDNLSQATFVPKTVQTDCLMEVAAGTCDAAVLDITLAQAMIGEGTDYKDLVIVDQLAEEFYGVAFRKGSDVCAATEEAFAALTADGTMTALAEKYGLTLAG